MVLSESMPLTSPFGVEENKGFAVLARFFDKCCIYYRSLLNRFLKSKVVCSVVLFALKLVLLANLKHCYYPRDRLPVCLPRTYSNPADWISDAAPHFNYPATPAHFQK